MIRAALKNALLIAAGLVERMYPELAPLIVAGPMWLGSVLPSLRRRALPA